MIDEWQRLMEIDHWLQGQGYLSSIDYWISVL